VARRAAEQGKVAYVPRGNTNTDCLEDRRTVYYIFKNTYNDNIMKILIIIIYNLNFYIFTY
jgi:hypothetical protein